MNYTYLNGKSFLLAIFFSLISLAYISAQHDLCSGAEGAPITVDCFFGNISETGSFNGTPNDPEVDPTCLGTVDVEWWAYQFDASVISFDFDDQGGGVVLFEGSDCASMTDIACETALTVTNDPSLFYFVAALDGESFEIVLPTIPGNEDCGSATSLSGTLGSESNVCATAPTGNCGGDHSVWYEVDVVSDGTTLDISVGPTGSNSIVNPTVAIYTDCSATTQVDDGACSGSNVSAECLVAGFYYIEVSSIADEAGEFEISESQSMTGPAEDVCSGAITLGSSPLMCGDSENESGDPTACPDPIATASGCMDGEPGTWYTFTTDPSLPNFTLTGSFELFEGSCGSLSSLGDCSTLSVPFAADPTVTYWILVDGNADFTLDSPVAPTNTSCPNAEEAGFGTTTFENCCLANPSTWYAITPEQNAVEISFTNNTLGGSFMVEIFDNPCVGSSLFDATNDFVHVLPTCSNDPYYMQVTSTGADCGSFDIGVDYIISNTPFGEDCASALTIPQPTTSTGFECLSSTTIYACDSDCSTNGVWFEVTTDVDASLMNIEVSATFDPVIQVLQAECAGGASLPCTITDMESIGVGGNQTYYIEVSVGPGTVPDDFTICVETLVNPTFCSEVTLEPSRPDSDGDDEGPFCGGEKVVFSCSVSFTSDPFGDPNGNNCQWLQGIIPSFGAGWDLEACSPWDQGPDDSDYLEEGAVWSKVNSQALGLQPSPHGGNEMVFNAGSLLTVNDNIPAGWWFTTPGGAGCTNDGTPNTMWGLQQGCGSTITVNFDLTLQVREDFDPIDCMEEDYLKVHMFALADGITGCWASTSCSEDAPATTDYSIDCDGLREVCGDNATTCSGSDMLSIPLEVCDGDAEISVEVSEESSTVVTGAEPHSFGSTGEIEDVLVNESCSIEKVIYKAFAINPDTGCKGPVLEIEVLVYPEVRNLFNLPNRSFYCAGETATLETNPSCGAGPPYTYAWSHGESTPTITIPHADPLPPGPQSVVVTVTDNEGCTERFEFDYETSQLLTPYVLGPTNICKGDGATNPKYTIRHEDNAPFINDYEWEILPLTGLVYTLLPGDSCIVVDDEASAAGQYMVTAKVIDELECLFDTTITILVDNGPRLTLEAGACNGNEIKLVGKNTNTLVMATNMHIVQIDTLVIPNVIDTLIGPLQTDSLCIAVTDFSGVFELRGASFGGCESAVALEIPAKPSPNILIAPPEICEGAAVNLTLSNPADFVSFTWAAGSSTWTDPSVTDSPTVTTTYTFTGIDANGCNITESNTVTVNPLPSVEITGSATVCNGGSSTLTAVVMNASGTVSYTWSNSDTGPSTTVSPLTSTTYTVTIRDEKDCSATASFTVEPATELSPSASAAPFCEGGMTTIDGGAGFDSWSWEFPIGTPLTSGGQLLDVSVPGTYGLTVSDAAGCTGSTTVEVNEISELPVAITATSATLCNADGGVDPTFINLDGLIENGVAGFWQDEMGNTISSPAVVSVITFAPGTYDYTFTTTGATAPCVNVDYTFMLVVQNCACPSVEVSTLSDYCLDGTDQVFDLGLITLTPESGDWSIVPATGVGLMSNQLTVSANSTPGTYRLFYSLDVTPPAPCAPISDAVEFTVWEPLVASLEQNNSMCNSDARGDDTVISLDGLVTGDMSGTWSARDATININGNNEVDFNAIAVGTYEFNYTILAPMGSACADLMLTTSIRSRDCACPDLAINALAPLCSSGGSYNLNQEIDNPDNLAGQWSIDPDVGSALVVDRFDAEGLPAGDYLISYTLLTPIAGCDDINIVTQNLEIIAPPVANVVTEIQVCNGDNITPQPFLVDLDTLVSGSSGVWSFDSNFSGTLDPVTNIMDFRDVSTDFYTFEYMTDTAEPQCDDVTYEVRVEVVNCNCPQFDTNAPTPLCTTDGTLDLDQYINNLSDLGSGSWVFKDGASVVFINGSEINMMNLNTGSYEIHYELDMVPLQCVRFHPVILDITNPPSADVITMVSPCNVDSGDGKHCIDLGDLATGAIGDWSIDNSFPGDASDLTNICFDTPGINIGDEYAFTYTLDNSANGCDDIIYTTTVRIADCNCPNLDIDDTPIELCQGETFDLSGIMDLFIENGSWTVENSATPITITGNTFVDAGVPVGSYELFYRPTVAPTDPNCPEFSTVMLELFKRASSGVPRGGAICANSETPIDLATLLIGADTGGNWAAAGTNPSSGGLDDIAGTFDPAGGAAGIYEFEYSFPANGPCPPTNSVVSVEVFGIPVADAGPDVTIGCSETATLRGVNPEAFGYSWTDDNGEVVGSSSSYEASAAGTYTLEIRDINGCTSTDDVVVTKAGDLEVTTELTQPNCEGQTGLLIVTTTGSGLQYSVDGGVTFQGSEIFSDLVPGESYTLVVSDDSGCSHTETFIVQAPSVFSVDAGNDRDVDLGEEMYTLEATVPAGAVITEVTWTDCETDDILCQGNYDDCGTIEVNPDIFNLYCVTIVDENGCISMDSVILRERLVRDVYIPNIFNPRETDPTNHTFHVHSDIYVEAVEYLNIYDRWGELVYAAPANHLPNDPANGWNGRWNNDGNDVAIGVYVYVIKVKYAPDTSGVSDTEIFSGDITIIR